MITLGKNIKLGMREQKLFNTFSFCIENMKCLRNKTIFILIFQKYIL